MLTIEEMQFMRHCLQAVRSGTPGLRNRPPQLQMMAAVARTLSRVDADQEQRALGAHLGVIEAGTGTGKTLGYLLPALALAFMRGRKLVVSSSTVTLQEQLLHKDVPALSSLLPFKMIFAVAKGRRRFLCPARLARLDRGTAAVIVDDLAPRDLPPDGPGAEPPQSKSLVQWHGKLSEAFERGCWNGDRDAWPQTIPDRVWDALSTDRQGCLGSLCPSYAKCPYYQVRSMVAEADLVIANHDLVLAAAGRDTGGTLPELSQALVVFDEAHALPTKVVGGGAARHSICAAGAWVAQAMRAAQQAHRALARTVRADVPDHEGAGRMLCAALGALLDAAARHCEFVGQQRVCRFAPGPLPPEILACGEVVREAGHSFSSALTGLRGALIRYAGADAHAVQPHLGTLGPFFARLEGLVSTWDWMLREDARGMTPVARWIELHAGAAGEDDFLVCASPIYGGPRLRSVLWERVGAAVLTSATLRACGRFDLFLEDAGLAGFEAVDRLALASPFDYARRATLRLARVNAHPRNGEAHTEEIVQRMPGLLSGQRGTLVLFASARQMREVHAALPEEMRDIILMQGEFSRRELIARHRLRIDQGGRSGLFGLAALAEGVDLPGEYCTHVICAKLPFSVPDNPVEQARHEWIEAQGRSAFLERSVPEVGIRLAQAVGRLLRTDDDHGTVTILDPRLGGTSWGRMLLRCLPPFRIVMEQGSGASEERGSTTHRRTRPEPDVGVPQRFAAASADFYRSA
ncbi:MAG TPA: ATP-dependent DNA helicase DinG [Pseudorhodoferax sp.]|nr:ATP-dependent DNA helicase DinG [Pseudorhodoferax sp.]